MLPFLQPSTITRHLSQIHTRHTLLLAFLPLSAPVPPSGCDVSHEFTLRSHDERQMRTERGRKRTGRKGRDENTEFPLFGCVCRCYHVLALTSKIEMQKTRLKLQQATIHLFPKHYFIFIQFTFLIIFFNRPQLISLHASRSVSISRIVFGNSHGQFHRVRMFTAL